MARKLDELIAALTAARARYGDADVSLTSNSDEYFVLELDTGGDIFITERRPLWKASDYLGVETYADVETIETKGLPVVDADGDLIEEEGD